MVGANGERSSAVWHAERSGVSGGLCAGVPADKAKRRAANLAALVRRRREGDSQRRRSAWTNSPGGRLGRSYSSTEGSSEGTDGSEYGSGGPVGSGGVQEGGCGNEQSRGNDGGPPCTTYSHSDPSNKRRGHRWEYRNHSAETPKRPPLHPEGTKKGDLAREHDDITTKMANLCASSKLKWYVENPEA